MPSLLGAGAEFIPNLDFPHFNNEVFKLDYLTTEETLIGYIYGGISSTQPNIFFINDGTQSSSNNQIFKVLIKKPTSLSVDDLNESSTNNLNLKIYPNPNDGRLKVAFNLNEVEDVKLIIHDLNGKIIDKVILSNLSIGSNFYEKDITKLTNDSVYFISIETSNIKTTHKLVVKR